MFPMIRFACGSCNERLAVPVRYAGRRGRCPACGAVNLVPTASEFPEPLPEPVMVQPGRMAARTIDARASATATSEQAGHRATVPPQVAPASTPMGSTSLPVPTVPWSTPAAPAPAPLPEVAPLPDDIPPGEMVLVSAFDDDAGGMSTLRKILIAAVVLVGMAGIIWGVSYMLIFVRMKSMHD